MYQTVAAEAATRGALGNPEVQLTSTRQTQITRYAAGRSGQDVQDFAGLRACPP